MDADLPFLINALFIKLCTSYDCNILTLFLLVDWVDAQKVSHAFRFSLCEIHLYQVIRNNTISR